MCLDRGNTLKERIIQVRPGIGYKFFKKDGLYPDYKYICRNMSLGMGSWEFCNNPTERIGSTMAGFHFFRGITSALKARKNGSFRKGLGYVLCKIEYLHPVAFGRQYGAAAGLAHAIKIIKEIDHTNDWRM